MVMGRNNYGPHVRRNSKGVRVIRQRQQAGWHPSLLHGPAKGSKNALRSLRSSDVMVVAAAGQAAMTEGQRVARRVGGRRGRGAPDEPKVTTDNGMKAGQ